MTPEDRQFFAKLLNMYDQIISGLEGYEEKKRDRIAEIYREQGLYDGPLSEGELTPTPEYIQIHKFLLALKTVIKSTKDARAVCNNVVVSHALPSKPGTEVTRQQ